MLDQLGLPEELGQRPWPEAYFLELFGAVGRHRIDDAPRAPTGAAAASALASASAVGIAGLGLRFDGQDLPPGTRTHRLTARPTRAAPA
jgi:hypothetical protein